MKHLSRLLKGKDPFILKKVFRLLFFLFIVTTQLQTLGVNNNGKDNSLDGTTPKETQQQRKITGSVVDATTGEPLIGVSIMIVGTSTGVVTDAKGKFTLNITNPNAQLKVTYMGYTTQFLPVKGLINIDIKLVSDVKNIGEVVVVGYGTQKKASVVGAITMVNNAALAKAGTQSITNAITGKLSGVLTIQQTGEPGSDNTEIVIRGVSSWNGSAPLTLVDGVERDFKDLDPAEVSSVSVLKDASATAVFGAKGANGVIIYYDQTWFIGQTSNVVLGIVRIKQSNQNT